MATSRVAVVLKALRTLSAAALPNVLVSLGTGVTENPGDFLMIGVDDPDATGSGRAADVSQSWAGLGNKARDEDGTLTCAAMSWNGDGDQDGALDAAVAILAAVETLLRTDPTLGGVLTPPGVAQMGPTFSVDMAQGTGGADCLIIFQIHYNARL